jgi:hypothetical protein
MRDPFTADYFIRRMLEESGVIPDVGIEEEMVCTSGRADSTEFFFLSDLRSTKALTHTPILAFIMKFDCTLEVRIITNPCDLLALNDCVKCMGQWRGRHRSDFFQFTIGDLRAHIAQYPKKDYQVI